MRLALPASTGNNQMLYLRMTELLLRIFRLTNKNERETYPEMRDGVDKK